MMSPFKQTMLTGVAIAVLHLGSYCSENQATGYQAVEGQRPDDQAIDVLPGTQRLEWEGDIASRMIDGIDAFLIDETEAARGRRDEKWNRTRTEDEVDAWLHAQRLELARILGIRDSSTEPLEPRVVSELGGQTIIAENESFEVRAIEWGTVDNLVAEGLLLTPRHGEPLGTIIAIADADHSPESIAFSSAQSTDIRPFAGILAQAGYEVFVPALLDREMERRNGRANTSRREFIYRSAFELGRHVIGYEIQSVLQLVDWTKQRTPERSVSVMGVGEGGMIALYAAAIDERIDATITSGYFGDRDELWQMPIERNVFGLLESFGDAEVATMIAPRLCVVDLAPGPAVEFPSEGGAPGRLWDANREAIQFEVDRAGELAQRLNRDLELTVIERVDSDLRGMSQHALEAFVRFTNADSELELANVVETTVLRTIDNDERQARILSRMDRHNQWLLSEAEYVRAQFLSELNTETVEAFVDSQSSYREFFAHEVIGEFDHERMPFNPRTRLAYEEEEWTGYEVVLDVYPQVFAYGILLVPNDLREGEQHPVVVCQHGLEGRPQDVVSGDHRAYHDFAANLAKRGFITFAPQNIYIFGDRFRTLQRKANPIKKTLFSVMVPQHQQIVDWLQTLDFVDPDRIAFYGLSYGGKSAMRIPALVGDYCLSICSADFNEWVWKNASSRSRYSYVWTGEYEIFEFDLGSTFNYAEMAALICPRPFMVERGHFDGVAPDETVAYEFAKVRHLYSAKLGLGDRCQIEWFVGPHTINGVETFEFLHRHLNWPHE